MMTIMMTWKIKQYASFNIKSECLYSAVNPTRHTHTQHKRAGQELAWGGKACGTPSILCIFSAHRRRQWNCNSNRFTQWKMCTICIHRSMLWWCNTTNHHHFIYIYIFSVTYCESIGLLLGMKSRQNNKVFNLCARNLLGNRANIFMLLLFFYLTC